MATVWKPINQTNRNQPKSQKPSRKASEGFLLEGAVCRLGGPTRLFTICWTSKNRALVYLKTDGYPLAPPPKKKKKKKTCFSKAAGLPQSFQPATPFAQFSPHPGRVCFLASWQRLLATRLAAEGKWRPVCVFPKKGW